VLKSLSKLFSNFIAIRIYETLAIAWVRTLRIAYWNLIILVASGDLLTLCWKETLKSLIITKITKIMEQDSMWQDSHIFERHWPMRIAMHEEFKGRLNSWNACYHSGQNLLFYCLPPKNVNITVHRTATLFALSYKCETYSLTLREEHSLKVFDNGVLTKIFWTKWEG
jgi:hypothetical protein